MKAGGFDAVIGNPPYGADSGEETLDYLRRKFEVAGGKPTLTRYSWNNPSSWPAQADMCQ